MPRRCIGTRVHFVFYFGTRQNTPFLRVLISEAWAMKPDAVNENFGEREREGENKLTASAMFGRSPGEIRPQTRVPGACL